MIDAGWYVELDESPLRYGKKRWAGKQVPYDESQRKALLLLGLEELRRLGRGLHSSDLVSLSPDTRRGTIMGNSSFLITMDPGREVFSYSDSKNPFHTNLNGGARSAPPNTVGIALSFGGVKHRRYSWLQDRPLGHVIWFTCR